MRLAINGVLMDFPDNNNYYAIDGVPIGVVTQVIGTTAPDGYLVCDGTEHLITSYPDLASYISTQYGTSNHFGGDGTNKFAVPTLTGELTYCIKAIAPKSTAESES